MTVYATWQDVKDTYELDMPDSAQPRVEKLLAQASARLTAMVPSLPARLDSGAVDPTLPNGMVVEAVLRVYRNPSGVTQQATGPFSRSLHATAARNEIYFDPEQVRALLAEANAELGIGSIQIAVPAPLGPPTGLDADGRYVYIPERYRGRQGLL